MDTEAAVIIDRLLPVDSNWKVFGNNRIYNRIDYRGKEWIVLAHLVEKFDCASILHALTNLRKIKRACLYNEGLLSRESLNKV